LLAKISPLVFPRLISRLLDCHSQIYLRLLGLVGKHFPPCLRLPYFKAFGFSPSYLPWAHGAIPRF